jgi:hypothetical protein
VQVLRPSLMSLASQLSSGARRQVAAMAAGNLDAILSVLDTALPVAASPLLKLAVLLSAAAAGTGSTALGQAGQRGGEEATEDTEPQTLLPQRAPASRNQVSGCCAVLCFHSLPAVRCHHMSLHPSLVACDASLAYWIVCICFCAEKFSAAVCCHPVTLQFRCTSC